MILNDNFIQKCVEKKIRSTTKNVQKKKIQQLNQILKQKPP